MPVQKKVIVDVKKAIEQMALDPKRVEKFLAVLTLKNTYEQNNDDNNMGVAMNS